MALLGNIRCVGYDYFFQRNTAMLESAVVVIDKLVVIIGVDEIIVVFGKYEGRTDIDFG